MNTLYFHLVPVLFIWIKSRAELLCWSHQTHTPLLLIRVCEGCKSMKLLHFYKSIKMIGFYRTYIFLIEPWHNYSWNTLLCRRCWWEAPVKTAALRWNPVTDLQEHSHVVHPETPELLHICTGRLWFCLPAALPCEPAMGAQKGLCFLPTAAEGQSCDGPFAPQGPAESSGNKCRRGPHPPVKTKVNRFGFV